MLKNLVTYKKHTSLVIILLMYALLSTKTSVVYAIYKYVGENGETVYSDSPPPTNKPKKIPTTPQQQPTKPSPAYAAPIPLSDREQRIIRAKSPTVPTPAKPKITIPEVILYSAPWCGYCTQARAYLSSKNIVYRDINIESREGASSFAQVSNGGGIPLLVSGTRRIQGFSQTTYDNFFIYKQ